MLSKARRGGGKFKCFNMSNGDEGIHWLDKLLEKRKWDAAELSRVTRIDSAVISNIKNGKRGVGIDTAKKMGKALNVRPEHILRLAGVFDPVPDDDEWVNEIGDRLKALPPDLRIIAEQIIEVLIHSKEQ